MDNSFGMNVIPENDQERVEVLKRYKILNTPPEHTFNNVAKLAAQIFNVPIALVSLVNTDEVFFKANFGMGKTSISERGKSLCSLAILTPEVTVFEDASREACLLANPLVIGEFGLKFYAGAPLITHDGFMIGTVCIIDKKTREFTSQDKEILKGLSNVIMDEIEMRLSAINETEKQQLITSLEIEARKQLEINQHRMENMVNATSMGMTVLKGRELIVEFANLPMLMIWNRTIDQVIGNRIMDIFPELADQPFPQMLAEIFNTGKTLAISEMEVDISTAEGIKHTYADFKYAPLFDVNGNVESIVATVIDINDIVVTRHLLEASEEEQQSLNEELNTTVEELAASNEELAAANEEMMATNEELAEIHQSLHQKITELGESENRFRDMIERAPVAMLVLRGPDLVFEIVNPRMQKLLTKGTEIIGKTLLEGLPEISDQPILEVIYQVYRTGEPYYGFERPVSLIRNGIQAMGYFDIVYTPLIEDGTITGVLQVVTEITEQIEIRKELQKAEEMLRFSIEAANVGTWYFDIATQAFVPSSSMKRLFGYELDEEMNYQNILQQIGEEYRTKVTAAASGTLYKGANFSVEFPAIGFHDQKIRWLRAIGKLDHDAEGKLSHFSGVVIEITEQKQDEIRKNDFIAMVSHELKTPLTSLKGYMQLLTANAKKSDDAFTINALERGNTQITKMTAMINGFLNVSRLESGKIYLEKAPFALEELMNDIIEEISITTHSHEIVMLPGDQCTITADADKIGQVINNFLSNAVKYSPAGSRIEVAVKTAGNKVNISVKDQGMGINPGDLDKIFDRFYRVQNQHAQNISGFGIGLYLCAEIVYRHDGRIWVESEIGEGSTFHFSIPMT